MKSWTEENGYPVVSVAANKTHLMLTQVNRFVYLKYVYIMIEIFFRKNSLLMIQPATPHGTFQSRSQLTKLIILSHKDG